MAEYDLNEVLFQMLKRKEDAGRVESKTISFGNNARGEVIVEGELFTGKLIGSEG